jgi:hypothetical protein
MLKVFIAIFTLSTTVFAEEAPLRRAQFPGAKDEDPIQVQEELKDIAIKVDRRTVEAKMRETLFKSKDAKTSTTPPKK